MNVKTRENVEKKRRVNYRKRKQMLFFASLVIIPILQFCICYIYVNISSFILAFQKYAPKEGALGFDITFAGFSNFKEAIGLISERMYMFKNSLLLFFWTTIVGLTLALLFSYYIYKKYPMSELFRVVLFIPKIMSAVVFCLLYRHIVNGVYPYIMQTVFHVTVQPLLDNEATRLSGMLFFSVWVSFGVTVLMFSGAMSGIDEAIVESAQLDGTNAIQEFIYITVPMIWPTFVSFLVINVAGLFTDQMHLHTMFGTGESKLATFGYYLFVESKRGNLLELGEGKTFSVLSSMGLMMTAVMLPITVGLRKLLRKFGPSVD